MAPVPFTSAPFTYPGGAIAVGLGVRVVYSESLVNARLYRDSAGTLMSNPVRTNSEGTIAFYAEPGEYDLIANGVTTPVIVPSGGGVPPNVDKGLVLPFSVAAGSGAGSGKGKLYNDTGLALTIRSVRVSVDTVTGAALIIDVKKNGVTIFTNPANRPTIAAPGGTIKNSTPDVTSVADGDYFTVDVVQSGTYQNLVVQIHLR